MQVLKQVFILILLLGFYNSYAQKGLIGYWSFDSFTSEKIKDNSAHGNNGNSFETIRIPGINGKALDFNGSNSFAKIYGNGQGGSPPEVLKQLGEGSISIWFKVRDIPLEHGIAPILYYGSTEKCDFFDAANNGLIIEIGHSPIFPGSEALFFTIWKNGCTYPSFCFDSNNRIEKNKWHHFVAVVGENYNTGYLNGEEIENRAYNFGNRFDSQFFEDAVKHEELWLGKGYWDRTTQFFNGAIDELKFFNRPLSAVEVKQLYNEFASTSQVKNENINPDFLVYPNPVSEILYVELANSDYPKTIEITDLKGRSLINKPILQVENEFDISSLKPGLYLVNLVGENNSFRKKIMVSR